jgi:general secretion pathway protein H
MSYQRCTRLPAFQNERRNCPVFIHYMKGITCQGFSLLEILVVLAVVALISAVAIPAIARGNPQRQLVAQAERLVQVLNLMCENAELDGRVMGLAIGRNQYAVLAPVAASGADKSDAPTWEPPKSRAAFAKFALPNGIALALVLGAKQESIELTQALPNTPQLPCAGTAELPEFQLRLSLTGQENAVSLTVVPQPASREVISSAAAMIAKRNN